MPSVESVCRDPCNRGEEQDGQELQSSDNTNLEARIVGQYRKDQPVLCNPLHPSSGRGEDTAPKPEPVVVLRERLEGLRRHFVTIPPASSLQNQSLNGSQCKVDDKGGRHNPHERMYVTRLTTSHLNQRVEHEASPYSSGDGIRKGHQSDCEERRDCVLHVIPFDFGHLRHHQKPDENEGRGRGFCGD